MEEQIGKIEADFFQYYHIDLYETPNSRLFNLIINLPKESRFIKEVAPASEWSFKDETLSRILYKIDEVSTRIYNSNRPKGRKAEKTDEQFQPDFIKEAKENYQKNKTDGRAQDKADMEATRKFWEAHNSDTKSIEEEIKNG